MCLFSSFEYWLRRFFGRPLKLRHFTNKFCQTLTPAIADRLQVAVASSQNRTRWVTLNASLRKHIISIGGRTERLLFIVESIESTPNFTASSSGVAMLKPRSSIGLPYFDSPICKKGVIGAGVHHIALRINI